MSTDEITIEPFTMNDNPAVKGKPAYTVNGMQVLVEYVDAYTTEELLERAISYGEIKYLDPDKNIYAFLWADRVAQGKFADPDKPGWKHRSAHE